MAREARVKALYSTYHIQQCCPKESIFISKDDRLIFLKTLRQVKEKYDFKLYGIAIEENGYELIVYDNGSDISRIMKSINISFSMKYKCRHENCDQLFKERYKSRILESEEIQASIDELPPCLYSDDSLIDVYESQNACVKDCIDCKDRAKIELLKVIEGDGYTYEGMLKDKKYRNELIKTFRKKSVLSLVELGEMFGGLSESAISKILSR